MSAVPCGCCSGYHHEPYLGEGAEHVSRQQTETECCGGSGSLGLRNLRCDVLLRADSFIEESVLTTNPA